MDNNNRGGFHTMANWYNLLPGQNFQSIRFVSAAAVFGNKSGLIMSSDEHKYFRVYMDDKVKDRYL